MAETLLISAEDDLWNLLETIINGSLPEGADLVLSNWQPSLIYLPDEPIGHTITPAMARAITGFHAALSRGYAYLVYGRLDGRVLRNDDYPFLNIRILTTAGSDGIEPVSEDLQKLAGKLVSKMTGKQITLSVVIYLLLVFSSPVAVKWIEGQFEAKRQDTDSHERLEQSEIDLHRLQLVTTALEQNPHLKPLQDAANEGKEALVKAVVDIPRSRILGASITAEDAKVISANPKEKGQGKRLDAVYRVTEIDNESEDGYVGRLRNVDTNEEFAIHINRSELSDEDIRVLFSALEQKTNVKALVNAYIVDGKVTSATIVRANPPEDDSGG